ncbi:MAG: LysR family transcriptional regulator [Ruthenibacterium sp.]
MEIRVLKYFLMVAREENITKAANLLHLTQPTLSRQLMQLEEELGVSLFRRSRHRIILTEDGMLLRRRAEEIVSLADKTKDDFQHRQEQLAGAIAVGSGEMQSSRFLTRLLTAFQRENPLVTFTIYSGNSDNIKERIERGLFWTWAFAGARGHYQIQLYPHTHSGTMGRADERDSELAAKNSVSTADLAGMPLIMPGRENLQNELLNWFGPYAENLRIIANGNLLYNLASLAQESGAGVLTLKMACSYPGLCFVPLAPKIETGTMLVWKKTQAFSPVATAFLAYSKKYMLGITQDLQ